MDGMGICSAGTQKKYTGVLSFHTTITDAAEGAGETFGRILWHFL